MAMRVATVVRESLSSSSGRLLRGVSPPRRGPFGGRRQGSRTMVASLDLLLCLIFGITSLCHHHSAVSAFVVPRQGVAAWRSFGDARRPPRSARVAQPSPSFVPSTATTVVSFFPRNAQDEDATANANNNNNDANNINKDSSSDGASDVSTDAASSDSTSSKKTTGGFLSSLARSFVRGVDAAASATSKAKVEPPEKPRTTADEAPAPSFVPPANKPPTSAQTVATAVVLTPEEQAQRFRSEAERIRLEAERMDAQLTLEKIDKLEKRLLQARQRATVAAGSSETSRKSSTAASSQEELESLQLQLQVLQTKLLGGNPNDNSSGGNNKTATAALTGRRASSSSSSSSKSSFSTSSSSKSPSPTASSSLLSSATGRSELKAVLLQQQQEYMEDIAETAELLRKSPVLLQKILAAGVDLDYDTPETLNVTELALRLQGLQIVQDKPAPTFTSSQIRERERQLQNDPQAWETVLPYLDDGDAPNVVGVNMTRVAILSLEYDYYFDGVDDPETLMERLTTNLQSKLNGDDEQWLVEVLNRTAADATIESLYPKCMRRGPEPTLAQVQQVVTDLRKIFPTTRQPEKVLGGYVLRGSVRSNIGTGDDLIAEIDAILAQKYPNGNAPVSIFYTPDFSIFLDPDAFETYDPEDVPPILYVTGPDVVPPSRRLALTAASAAGLATCWYLAIYPFLLNPVLAKRVEEQLALGDAGMAPDLNWLSDLSLPLFFAFLGIQIAGEVGHQVVASANKVKLSVPTFVPSLITGITSTVTTFKTPPPNKTAMCDIALAGPLVSIAASLLAIAIGSSLTLTSDPSTLPALPLEILRQSTLGGGIINGILGNGVLSIPEGAQGTAAVAGITIPLHPVAVAGYISLIVNALSLLPIGTTDGGRVALAVFGRGAKLLIGNVFLLMLLFVGFLGSDLFLFYFGFIVLFQTGNEIAARNEVDKVEFSRVALAIAANVLMLLTLIPFQ